MSNLPLKALPWTENNYAGIVTHTAKSPLHDYTIRYDELERAYLIDYYERMTNEHGSEFFKSVDEAKQWAQSTHYRDKMQPYVVPSPTWVDVNQREPTEKGDYLIRDYQGRVAMGKYDKGFYMESGGDKWGYVQCWMPIPEFKQGE